MLRQLSRHLKRFALRHGPSRYVALIGFYLVFCAFYLHESLHIHSQSRKYYLFGLVWPHSGYRTSGRREEFAYFDDRWHHCEWSRGSAKTSTGLDVPAGSPSVTLYRRRTEAYYGLTVPCIKTTRNVPVLAGFDDLEYVLPKVDPAIAEEQLLRCYAADVLHDESLWPLLRGGNAPGDFEVLPLGIAYDLGAAGFLAMGVWSFVLRKKRRRLRTTRQWQARVVTCPRCQYDRQGITDKLCPECAWPRSSA